MYRCMFECRSKTFDELRNDAPNGCVLSKTHIEGDAYREYIIMTISDDKKLHRRIDKFVELYDEGEMSSTDD